MTLQPTTNHAPQPAIHDELILVVKRNLLFPQEAFQGFKPEDFGTYLTIINEHQEFKPRSQMEQDPTYKQIIPYLIFKHADRYFVMQRHKKASEQRLQSKFSLGIGGHINKEDIQSANIFNWAQREFYEEVNYNGNLTVTPLGIINDDANAVGQVHIGFTFLLQGDSADISVKSELQSGTLMTLEECKLVHDRMETWSQMLVPFL